MLNASSFNEEEPSRKERQMQNIHVHELFVPKESQAEFLESARRSAALIKGLPGFIEGFLYEKKEGESRFNFMTIAVWESEEAYENAKAAVTLDNKQRGYNPQETTQRLGIEREQTIFQRSSF
jgi:heme-degrading monooxygenase HmoA